MARRKIGSGSISNTVSIFVKDTTSSAGAGLGGITSSSLGLIGEYRRQGQSFWTPIPLVPGALGLFVSGGWAQDGNLIGAYEVSIPDAAFAIGAEWMLARYYGASHMLPLLLEFELDAINYQNSVNLGLSAFTTIQNMLQGQLGSGINIIKITLIDETSNIIIGKSVSIYSNTILMAGPQSTNQYGFVTFYLNPATYIVYIQDTPQYQSFVPQNLTVSSNVSLTYQLSNNNLPSVPVSNASLCTVYGFILLPNGLPAVNTSVVFQLVSSSSVSSSSSVISFQDPLVFQTDVNGYLEATLLRTDMLNVVGVYWNMSCKKANIDSNIILVSPTANIETLISSDVFVGDGASASENTSLLTAVSVSDVGVGTDFSI